MNATQCTSRICPAGEVIFRENETDSFAYILQSGLVELSIERVGKRVVLTRVSPGDLFGEHGILGYNVRAATAIAIEDCRIWCIRRESLNKQIANGDDAIINLFLKLILERYQQVLGDPTMPAIPLPDKNQQARSPSTPPHSQQPLSRDPVEAALQRMQLETEMRTGLDRGEFIVYYQPIIHLRNKKVAGFEALIRWQHPERGLLAPFDFINLAEQTGLIIDMGDVVLKQACQDLPRLEAATTLSKNRRLFMSVNVSGRQLGETGYIKTIANIIQKTKISPKQLKLEITESLFMETPEVTVQWIHACRNMGITIALDDFGTGFSSLGYLYQFPIDNIKIDRAFVNVMCHNDRAMKVVRSITGLARGLHLTVIAEGIEKTEQIPPLLKLGSIYGQGHLFSKPTDIETMCDLMATNQIWPTT